jgi:c-di-GMP-binding flagellar brake protein YcgR
MSRDATLDAKTRCSVLEWAAQRRLPLTVSILSDGRWCNMRSQILAFDARQQAIQIVYPIAATLEAPPEIPAGQKLGISFRRGHKKCVFVSIAVVRRMDVTEGGQPVDSLIVTAPEQMRELQRRAYQRVMVPADRFIAVKLWQGGAPSGDDNTWPLCSGRLSNLSLGGLLADVRVDQNPRLSAGDIAGVEIKPLATGEPLIAEAQFRHCTLAAPERLGIGLQFMGLEHDTKGLSSITQIAELVAELRRSGGREQAEE